MYGGMGVVPAELINLSSSEAENVKFMVGSSGFESVDVVAMGWRF